MIALILIAIVDYMIVLCGEFILMDTAKQFSTSKAYT